jgi:hypothetical protein
MKHIKVTLSQMEYEGIRRAAEDEELSIPEFLREVAYGRVTPVGLAPGERQRRSRQANQSRVA